MLRAHEFDKVEILAIATPEQSAGAARRPARPRRGDDRRARPAVPDDRDLHRRPRPEPPPQLRRRGLLAGHRHVARGVVGELVLRLPGSAGEHPLPPRAARRARRSPTRSTARRSPCPGCGRRSSRTTASPTARCDPRGAAPVHARPTIAPLTTPMSQSGTARERRPNTPVHIGRPASERCRRAAARRVEYETAGLDVADVAADPLHQWRRWYDDASAAGVVEPNAMTIATVGLDGHPTRGPCSPAAPTTARSCSSPTSTASRAASSSATRMPPPCSPGSSCIARSACAAASSASTIAESDDYFAGRPRRQSARCLGVAAERGPRRPRRARTSGRRVPPPLRRRRRATSAVLGRLAARGRDRGVLAGAAEPAARPRPLPPRLRGWVIERLAPCDR